MYAAYNTALGYEMQDSIDTALEWALKAQTLAREKSKTDKKETGEIHNGTISYYIFISMYVDELEQRRLCAGLMQMENASRRWNLFRYLRQMDLYTN